MEKPSEASNESTKIKSNLSALANEFVPQQYVPDDMTGDYSDACYYLSQTLDYLHADPEELPAVLIDLRDQFMIYVDDLQCLEILIDTLINKCIETGNFQYMGAQCSVHLCHVIINSAQEMIFQELFLKQCNLTFKEYVTSDQLKPFHTNFTLFITELTLFLKRPDGKCFNILIKATIDLLIKSLEFISDESIKCLQQVIKMSGFTLQDEEPTRYEKLLNKMKFFVDLENVSKRQKEILFGIISRERLPTLEEQVTNELNDVTINSENTDASKDQCSYNICHDVTILSQDSEQYVIANEDAEPEIFEDYELFVCENESHMDAFAEEEYEHYLQSLENKR